MSTATITAPYEEVYCKLVERDAQLVDTSLERGLETIAEQAFELANDCAKTYGALWEQDQLHAAEDLRKKMRFWASKYRQVTGEPFYPQVAKVNQSHPQAESMDAAVRRKKLQRRK